MIFIQAFAQYFDLEADHSWKGTVGNGFAYQKGSKMTKYQNKRSTTAVGLLIAVSTIVWLPHRSAHASDVRTYSVKQIEEQIFEANPEDLPAIEIRIAHIMQKDPGSPSASYLMSALLLKMFTTDPGSFSLIRQSTELAAQTYELDKKGDWAIASLASILEISGETSRGLDLIRDAGKRGITIGWRTNLAKARLLFDGRNGDAVLDVLETVLKDPDHSSMIVAPTLIAAITSAYHGDEQIRQLQLWRKKCASVEMDMAIANAHALSLNYDEALREYSQVIAKHPAHAEALLSKGIITLSHKKDTNAAIKLFEKAINHAKFENDKIAAETHLALALIPQKKSVDQAISASIRAIAEAGDREAVLMTILTSFRKNQGLKPTLKFLENLYNKVPGLHLAHAIKGELLSEQLGRHMDATRDFTNAITLDPSRSEYYNGRGLAFLGMSNLEAALNDFETAVTTNPGDASARYNIACVQARLGMKSDAIISLSKAFELDDRLLTHALTDKDLVTLHSDPEFKALMSDDRKMSSVAH